MKQSRFDLHKFQALSKQRNCELKMCPRQTVMKTMSGWGLNSDATDSVKSGLYSQKPKFQKKKKKTQRACFCSMILSFKLNI